MSEITTKQAAFLNRLLDEAVEMLDEQFKITSVANTEACAAVQSLRNRVDDMTSREASAAIDMAMDNNRVLRTEIKRLRVEHGSSAPAATTVHEYVSETGMYRVGERIFKVLPSRNSDRHYATELTGFHFEGNRPVSDVDDGTMKFQYVKGAMALIKKQHRMSLEEELEFGRLTGHCADCGKLLTKPRSIEYGKGPVCSDNYKH